MVEGTLAKTLILSKLSDLSGSQPSSLSSPSSGNAQGGEQELRTSLLRLPLTCSVVHGGLGGG